MKNLLKFFLILFIPALFLRAQSSFTDETGIHYLKENLSYLASDELEGRAIATKEIELAGEYISQQLEKYNVKPFGENGTYFQSFPILETRVDSTTKLKLFTGDNKVETFLIGEDFYLSTLKTPSEKFSGIKSDIVFAGYGLSSAEINYDDYANIDVEGKIVLVLRDIPSSLPDSLFLEGRSRMYGAVKYKISNAEKHGAVGILMVPSGWMRRNWQFIVKQATSPEVSLKNDSEENQSGEGSIPAVYISEEMVKELLQGEEYSYDELRKLADDEENLPAFNLKKKAVLDYQILNTEKSARNVIGIVEGIDEKLKNEFVVLSAHYDHEGIVNGQVYNGADDDGSGTVAILEAARRLAMLNKNKRSVMIVFHTGEEEGLIGSNYITSHSKYLINILADINVDMVGRGSIDTIFSIGSGRLSNELYKLVEKVNSETVDFTFDYRFDSPNDPNRYYYRSDHYNYAKHNIPVVFFYDNMTIDYHKPTDDVDKINFKKLDKVSTLITQLALEISNLDHRLILDSKKR